MQDNRVTAIGSGVGTFADRLRALMRERGLSQRKLAVAAGLSDSAVSQYLSGSREPNLRVFSQLCSALEVSPSALLPITWSVGGGGKGQGALASDVREAASIVSVNAALLSSQERRSLVNALFDAEGRAGEKQEAV